MLAVFVSFSDGTKFIYEQAIVNESLGTGAGTYTTAYDAKANTTAAQIAIYNGTDVCGDCTLSFTPGESATMVAGSDVVGAIEMSYTGYSIGAYESFEKIGSGTESGYNLASMIPYIIVAVTIIALMLNYLGVF